MFMLFENRLFNIDSKYYMVALLCVFGIASFLRFHELGQPYLWQDEIHTVWPAKHFLEGLGFSKPVGTEPYLRAWITSTLPVATSFSILGYTEFAARLPSVLIGLSTVLVTYLLGKDVGGKKLGLLVSGIMALDFWVINWHTEARMYVHNQFLYILGVWLMFRWYNRDSLDFRSRYLFALIPTILFGIHNHKSYLGLGPAIGLFLVLSLFMEFKDNDWRLKISQNSFVKKHLKCIFFGSVTVLMYLAINGIPFPLLDLAPTWYVFDRGVLYYLRWLSDYNGLIYFFGIGSILIWRQKKNWIIPLAFGIPFVVQSFLFFKEPRFIFHLYPLFIVIMCIPLVYSLNIVISYLESRNILTNHLDAISIFAVILIIFSISPPIEELMAKEERPHEMLTGSNHRGPTNYISERRSKDDLLLSSAPSITAWYMGDIDEVDYDLNYLENENISGELVDRDTGIEAVKNKSEMEKIISGNSGWVIADANFYKDFRIKNEVRRVIIDNSRKIEKSSWREADIYRFK